MSGMKNHGVLATVAFAAAVAVCLGASVSAGQTPEADRSAWLAMAGETRPPAMPAEAEAPAGEDNSTWLAMADKPQEGQAAKPAPASGDGKGAQKESSLGDIGNKLNNPGADLAQLNFKLTWNEYKGNLPGSSSQDSLTLLFQPVFPFKLPDGGNLIFRPTLPFLWSPYFDASKGGFGEQFGFGDAQLDVFYSRTNVKKGYMWGLGAVMQAPTHTDDVLGKDQFQLGPAGFVGLLGKWGSAGVFPQHLWNVCGSGEGYTATTNIQPWYWFNVGGGWQVGGSPVITYDWAADDSDQAWTVPVNLGVSRVVKVGKTPVKLKFEAIYYIKRPNDFGPHWGLQLTITPVVPNALESLFK